MIVLGLTGGIAMGKSTAASMFTRRGAALISADAIVHRLLSSGGAGVEPVAAMFPSALKNGAIDRKALGDIVFHDREKLKELEYILHPLVEREEEAFIRRARLMGKSMVVLDIPLLFETDAHLRVDAVAAVSAPGYVQRRRALARPGMTEKKLDDILSRQLPDKKRRRRADFVIPTGLGLAQTRRTVRAIMETLHGA
jgi:dephospho-CoA kinase